MLDRNSFKGLWAGLPVAWTEDDRFDERIYRADVARCCQARVAGVYTGGTTGEFYAMEFDEFQAVARATVETCREHGVPAMIGCTSTYTLGAMRRAKFAAEIGADAVQAALPYWMEVGHAQIVPFFVLLAEACGGLPLSVYETRRAKRTLSLEEHAAIADATPSYAMVKANAGTLGSTPEGCRALSEIVNVFVGEDRWLELGPAGASGCCSSMVYWNPQVMLQQWSRIAAGDWEAARPIDEAMVAMHDFLHHQFGDRGFTDTAYDRLGAIACGFLGTSLRSRGPYPSPTWNDVAALRAWLRKNFAELPWKSDACNAVVN